MLYFSYFSTIIIPLLTASKLEVGWPVIDRPYPGNSENQMWITPVECPYDGVVTHWRYWRSRSVPIRFMVFRNVDTPSSDTLYDIIGINDIPEGDTNQALTYQVPDDERISVLAGDVIVFAWSIHAVFFNSRGDDDEIPLLLTEDVSPDRFSVNDRIDTSGFLTVRRAYSISAILSGIVTIVIKIEI